MARERRRRSDLSESNSSTFRCITAPPSNGQQGETKTPGRGPLDPNQTQIESNFAAPGAFSLALDPTGKDLRLIYIAATPEPSHVLLIGAQGMGAVFWGRRRLRVRVG
jgi:hypothetical protein